MHIGLADVVWFPAREEPPPGVPRVRVERHGTNWHRNDFDMWMPAASLGEMGQIKTDTIEKKLLGMFILFNTIVVRDGVDPKEVHQAFLRIDEYRRAISPDTPGAEG